MSRRDQYSDPRRPIVRSGTARRDQFGNLVPGEYDQYQQPIVAGGGLRTGGLATGSTAGTPGDAFDRKFGAPQLSQMPPTRTIVTPAPAPAPAPATAGKPAFDPENNATFDDFAREAKPAAPAPTTRTVSAPDAFGTTRRGVNGGSERWQPSESSATGGRWVGSTSPTPIVPPGMNPGHVINPGTSPFNTEGQRLTQTVGSGGAATVEYDPRHDTGIASIPTSSPGAAPGAVRAVAVNPRYVTPGTTGVGSVTRRDPNDPRNNPATGRLMDEHGDQTGAVMGNLAKEDAFARNPQALPAGVTASAQARHDVPATPAPMTAAAPMTPPATLTPIGTRAPAPAAPAAPTPAYPPGSMAEQGSNVAQMVRGMAGDVANETKQTFVDPVKRAANDLQNVYRGATGQAATSWAPQDTNTIVPAARPAPTVASVPSFPFSYTPPMPSTVTPGASGGLPSVVDVPGDHRPDPFRKMESSMPGLPATGSPLSTLHNGAPKMEMQLPTPTLPADPEEQKRRRLASAGAFAP